MSGPLTCRELTTEEEFADIAPAWEALYARCAYAAPFCTWEWAWHWWRAFGAADTLAYALRIIVVTDADGVAALAPFYYPTQPGKPLCLRPLRLLGTRIRCREEDVFDEPVLLLRAGTESAALRALTAHLARARRAPWDLVHLRLMREADALGLAEVWGSVQAEAGQALTHRRVCAGQYVALPDSWPAFRQSLSKSMRDNLSYYPRLLARHGHRASVRTARTQAEVAEATDTLIGLHHARARSAAGTPHHDHLPSPGHERFLRAVLPALAAQGRAFVVLLEVGGCPVAAQAVLEDDRMLTFHYSGFAPAWAAYSPITLLNAHVLEAAIARGVRLANYLPQVEPWKARWRASELYVLDELTWVPVQPRPLLRLLYRSFLRVRQRRGGDACDCGFCALPPTSEALTIS